MLLPPPTKVSRVLKVLKVLKVGGGTGNGFSKVLFFYVQAEVFHRFCFSNFSGSGHGTGGYRIRWF